MVLCGGYAIAQYVLNAAFFDGMRVFCIQSSGIDRGDSQLRSDFEQFNGDIFFHEGSPVRNAVVWKRHFSTGMNPRPTNPATVRKVSLVNMRELLRRWHTCPQSAVYFSVMGGWFGLQPLRLRVRGGR